GYRELITGETGLLLPTRWAAHPDWLTDLAPVLYERPLHLLLGQSIEVDLPAMARALNDLARDDTRREAMGRAARARARARFDWRVVIRAYEEVWRRLAAKPFRPERPGREPAPLAMSYRALFAHYPSVEADTERIVRRLPLADALCGPADRYPVYPELEEVFDEEDVTAAVGIATEPVAVDQLSRALEARWPPCEAWRARILVAWLLKHGLLG
ncbi:MAG TPA: hypothetical protein PLB02_02830, partial [Thermoanaerobaculia bacterium]|nr:hypothetical protein [Thermoanaerobaculia bacterium]